MRLRGVTIFIVALTMLHVTAYGWSKKGHDVIAYIAETHLTDRAHEAVSDLLDGRSMIYYANWMDNASNTKEFKHTKTWHYFNISRNKSVETTERIKSGDGLSALIEIEAQLRDGNLSHQDLSDRLKMFIHIVADIHQPMHLGRSEDNGGNKIPVTYFNEATSLHALWDYFIVNGAHEWSYTEWGLQIDILNDEQRNEVIKGDYTKWIEATHKITNDIYRNTPAESYISYDYIERYRPIVEQQLLYAGLRLAALLNSIYK